MAESSVEFQVDFDDSEQEEARRPVPSQAPGPLG